MSENSTPRLQVKGVSKRFGALQALSNISFEVGRGEVLALLGDNGAGKSTMIKIISGSHQPDDGELLFDGKRVQVHNPHEAKDLGIETVYQDLSLCPNMDVVANFFMGRELTRNFLGFKVLREKEMEDFTRQSLADIGSNIPDLRKRVEYLSGGQRQAIELARFVAWGGKLVMLDEPFAALGVEQTKRGLQLIETVRKKGISIIVITHNIAHAFQVADRIIVFRQGQVVGIKNRKATNPDEVVNLITGDL